VYNWFILKECFVHKYFTCEWYLKLLGIFFVHSEFFGFEKDFHAVFSSWMSLHQAWTRGQRQQSCQP
jgi:hypothetical protein